MAVYDGAQSRAASGHGPSGLTRPTRAAGGTDRRAGGTRAIGRRDSRHHVGRASEAATRTAERGTRHGGL
ncbi:MAG: hypothetical protein MZU91_08560 [Desulfosudis oleivorans]|nr:hypothetical protein [Desulfosudis oleivorans]